LRDLGKMLAKANLPRASSHGNMFVCDTSSMTGMGSLTSPLSPNHQHRPDLSLSSQPSSFSKSDICLERPPPPQTLATFLENSSPSPSRQLSLSSPNENWNSNRQNATISVSVPPPPSYTACERQNIFLTKNSESPNNGAV